MEDETLTIVYDNRTRNAGLQPGWGFACLAAYDGKRILFDTGNDAKKTASNLKVLGIDPAGLDAVVLSHAHWDHTGGLAALLEAGMSGPVYFPQAFPADFKWRLKQKGVQGYEVLSMIPITERIFAGPEMRGRGPHEIPLILETGAGLVLLTGCAHPGILQMIKEVKTIFGQSIFLVVGGFHWAFSLMLKSKVKQLKRLEVDYVAPCHCTGPKAIGLIEKEYGNHFIEASAGTQIRLRDLGLKADA